MNILMLDLEGVIVLDGNYYLDEKRKKYPDYDVLSQTKNYAQRFLDFCAETFDEVYANTCLLPEEAEEIFRRHNHSFKYWPWLSEKTEGYEQFAGQTLIHVEDGITPDDKKILAQLGFHYVGVRDLAEVYDTANGLVYDREADLDLINAQRTIEKILQK